MYVKTMKKDMNLKKRKKGYMGRFRGSKVKEKWWNYKRNNFKR